MKYTQLLSIVLLLAILLLSLFIGGRQINIKIEDTIKANYENDIAVLKDKINKHSELINSIISVNDKNDLNENTIDTNQTTNVNTIEFEYEETDDGIAITKYIGNQTNVIIPNKINGLPVVKISENAFSETKIKSITLPAYCKEIDWFAFYGCFSLSTAYIPSSVTVIGYGAFEGCSKSLTIYSDDTSYAKEYAKSFGIKFAMYN